MIPLSTPYLTDSIPTGIYIVITHLHRQATFYPGIIDSEIVVTI